MTTHSSKACFLKEHCLAQWNPESSDVSRNWNCMFMWQQGLLSVNTWVKLMRKLPGMMLQILNYCNSRNRHKYCILKSLPFKIWDNGNSLESSHPLVWDWGSARPLQMPQGRQAVDSQAYFPAQGGCHREGRRRFDKSQSVLGAP